MSQRASFLTAVLVAWLGFCILPVAAQEDLNDLQEKALKDAVARVATSVVQIDTSGGTEIISTGPRGAPVRKGVGPTTGLIVSQDGYVISSAFNFANKPTAIFVTVPGHKERHPAKLVATDTTRMLTLLKIDANGLTVPQPAPKKDIKIGQWAMALGRTLDRPEDRELKGMPAVSIGVVSALNRIWGKAVQTDAKVSPVNYGGPLVNVRGEVMGVLVPASPEGEGETAGVQYYDSGIGFAIPLEDINKVLPRLREGRDLRRGLLGVTMQVTDQFATAPVVATVTPASAAEKAGLKVGDQITTVDGKVVNSYAQLQHLLGGKYEGDEVSVTVKRGGKPVKFDSIKLAGTLTSFPHPFIGVLPLRDDPDPGEEIRYVYPDSPAAKAGLKAGDRIMKVALPPGAAQPFTGRDQLTGLLNRLQPGIEIKVDVQRKADKKIETLTIKLAALPDTIPDKLPDVATLKKAKVPLKPAGGLPKVLKGGPKPKDEKKDEKKDEAKKKDEKKPEIGFFKKTNPGRDHDYYLYVPEAYDANVRHALVIWLHPAGKNKDKDFEDFARIWKTICDDHHIILLMPKAENENGWLSSESDAVVQIANDVLGEYMIDKQRVIAHGMGVGGQLAFYLGFTARDLIRGVATTGAVMTSALKDNVGNQRLQFFVASGEKDPLVKEIQASATKLTGNKFSVVYREVALMGHQYLNFDPDVLGELARWIDSLDRQ